MHFDFIDLRLLAAVLETGSITAGAERVGLSLAAASARMRGLEQQAGVALLTRNPRGVQATPAGERLLQHARVLQQRDRLRVTWPSSRQASAASCASSPIPSPPTLSAGAAGGFSGAAPTHRHRAGGAAQPGHRAGDRRTGGGYRHRGGSRRSARADKLPFPAGSSGAGAAAGHALSGRRTVSFADTLSFEFIGLPEESALQQHLEQLAIRSGGPMRLRARAANFDAICRMAARRRAGGGAGRERPTPSADPTRRPAADGRLGDPAPVAGGARMQLPLPTQRLVAFLRQGKAELQVIVEPGDLTADDAGEMRAGVHVIVLRILLDMQRLLRCLPPHTVRCPAPADSRYRRPPPPPVPDM